MMDRRAVSSNEKMEIKVVSVREADGGGAVLLSVEISAEGGKSESRELMLTAAQYRERRLRRGDTLSPDEFDALEALSETARAARRGAGILSYGANSRAALRRKLILKGFSREAAEAAVEILDGMGLIDEKNAALREAERCAAQCRGRKYIEARLYSLGYRGEATAAAEKYLDGVDFAALCAGEIERKYGGGLPAEPYERDRAVASLMRRGFSVSDIRDAVKTLEGR